MRVVAGVSFGVVAIGLLSAGGAQAETRGFVVSAFFPAVYSQDGDCAGGLNLNAGDQYDLGLVAAGYRANLNVIDYDRLDLLNPRVVADLPAGGKRLHQRADGYVATIVSGVPVYRNGVETGELPGRVVRGTQAGPAH